MISHFFTAPFLFTKRDSVHEKSMHVSLAISRKARPEILIFG